jgi:chromosomal replication initiation ATPase DnaA
MIVDLKSQIKELGKLVQENNSIQKRIAKLMEGITADLLINTDYIPPSTIIDMIKEEYDVDITKITRKKEFIHARRVLCYLLKQHTNLTLVEIANRCGLTDHTTALYHINIMNNYLEVDDRYRNEMEYVELRLKKYHEKICDEKREALIKAN